MDASEHATNLAIAITDGLNTLAHIQSLRASPVLVSAAEMVEWRETLDRTQRNFTEIQAETQAGRVQTSLRVTGDLVRSIADVCSQLSTTTPGAQLPAKLFDLVDVASLEFAKGWATASLAAKSRGSVRT